MRQLQIHKVVQRLLLGCTVLALLGGTVALAALPPGGSFSDDDGNVHEGTIEAIAAANITKGCNPPINDLYCPDEAVTRGQMAAFLRRAFLLPAASEDVFDDDSDSVFERDINALAEAGITRGCNPPQNDRFCPEEPVTRGQMAAFLQRAFPYDPAHEDHFADDTGSTFEDEINAIASAGVTKGCNPPANTLYCPDDLVRRDQMASFLARALGLEAMTPPPATSSTSTTVTTVPEGRAYLGWRCTPPQTGDNYTNGFRCDEVDSNGFAVTNGIHWECTPPNTHPNTSNDWQCSEVTERGWTKADGTHWECTPPQTGNNYTNGFRCDEVDSNGFAMTNGIHWECTPPNTHPNTSNDWQCEGSVVRSAFPLLGPAPFMTFSA